MSSVWQARLSGRAISKIDLQGLRHALFPFVNADERVDLEFAQKYDVHVFGVAFGCRGGIRVKSAVRILRYSR